MYNVNKQNIIKLENHNISIIQCKDSVVLVNSNKTTSKIICSLQKDHTIIEKFIISDGKVNLVLLDKRSNVKVEIDNNTIINRDDNNKNRDTYTQDDTFALNTYIMLFVALGYNITVDDIRYNTNSLVSYNENKVDIQLIIRKPDSVIKTVITICATNKYCFTTSDLSSKVEIDEASAIFKMTTKNMGKQNTNEYNYLECCIFEYYIKNKLDSLFSPIIPIQLSFSNDTEVQFIISEAMLLTLGDYYKAVKSNNYCIELERKDNINLKNSYYKRKW